MKSPATCGDHEGMTRVPVKDCIRVALCRVAHLHFGRPHVLQAFGRFPGVVPVLVEACSEHPEAFLGRMCSITFLVDTHRIHAALIFWHRKP